MAKFKSKEGLEIDFRPNAKLEVNTRGNVWVQTTPFFFRSWGGNRRIDGIPFEGNVYYLGNNEVATSVNVEEHA